MTRVNDHDIYRHCLKLAKAILRRGNIKGQQLYVHVAEKKYWETELLRIYQFEGKNRGKLANLGLKHDGFVLGEPQPFTNFSEKNIRFGTTTGTGEGSAQSLFTMVLNTFRFTILNRNLII